MPGSALSDLSGLLRLARSRDLDLRPVILRVQTDLFVSATARDRALIESFEALANGLIPTVDDETAAIVAAKLAPVADTPQSVLASLAARGGAVRRAVIERAPALPAAALAATGDRAGPAADPQAASGAALDALLERARRDPALAGALLARADLPAAHAAALYLQADAARRAAIRAAVEPLAALRAAFLPSCEREAADALVERAMAGDAAGFARRLSTLLRLPADTGWDFAQAERHDLLPLALRAAGIGEEDAVRIILTLERGIALSVDEVFRLVRVYRQTPRPAAAYLIEAIIGPAAERSIGRHLPHMEPGGTRLRGVPAAPAEEREPARPERAATR